MTSRIDTILVIGATSGIGEAFARHYHSIGKKVIIAGRRVERLDSLKAELKGIETVRLDVEDVKNLEVNLHAIIKSFPTLDSVMVLPAIASMESFTDPKTIPVDRLISQITINFTSVVVVAKALVPHLVSLKRPATFITVGSALAFVPLDPYPIYNATKAGTHVLTVDLRSQLADTEVRVIELVPPYVDTEINEDMKNEIEEAAGAGIPMALAEFMSKALALMEKDGQKEIAVGFAEPGVAAYRKAVDPLFEHFKVRG